MSEIRYVTADNWSVAFETGTGITGANLHVGVYVDDAPNDFGGRGVYYRHECYGMNFPTVEAAKQYAIEQGFLMPYIERSLDEMLAHRQQVGIVNEAVVR